MSRKLSFKKCPETIKQQVIDLYVDQKLSSVAILSYLKSIGFNVSYSSIMTFLHKAGVIRSRSDATKYMLFSEIRQCKHCNRSFNVINNAQVYCRTCCPTKCAYQRLRYYNLSQPEFERILYAQQKQCKLCQTELIDGGATNLNVDHDHTTGKVRGLLCHKCNMIVGFIEGKNLSERLEILKRYIEQQ